MAKPDGIVIETIPTDDYERLSNDILARTPELDLGTCDVVLDAMWNSMCDAKDKEVRTAARHGYNLWNLVRHKLAKRQGV